MISRIYGLFGLLMCLLDWLWCHEIFFSKIINDFFRIFQSVLTTPETICLDMTPLKLCKNMTSRKFSGSLIESPMFYPNKKPEYLDSRIETTLILSGLKSAYLLTHLRMTGSACDNFLKCVRYVFWRKKLKSGFSVKVEFCSSWLFLRKL